MEPAFDISKKDAVISYLLNMIHERRQPSGSELLSEVEKTFGWQVRWRICEIICELVKVENLTGFEREYFLGLLDQLPKTLFLGVPTRKISVIPPIAPQATAIR